MALLWEGRAGQVFTHAPGWLNVYRERGTREVWTTQSPGILTVCLSLDGGQGQSTVFAEITPRGEIIPAWMCNPADYAEFAVEYVTTIPADEPNDHKRELTWGRVGDIVERQFTRELREEQRREAAGR